MAASTLPMTGITLHGPSGSTEKHASKSAILLRLSDSLLEDLKRARKELQFVTGKAPKLRLGNRSIDLGLTPEPFRNDLYTTDSATDFTYSSAITHRAEMTSGSLQSAAGTAGTDAALAALQTSLASYEQEKKASSTTIVNSMLPQPKHRFDAARQHKRGLLVTNDQSRAGSPSVSAAGTPRLGAAPTSVPTSDSAIKLQAMKAPVIHLLAMKPTSTAVIQSTTNIPKEDLDAILSKIGKQENGKWTLMDKAYKELDVWDFEYATQEDRQAAVDHAIKAFDRQRLGKEEKLWQMLLPKDERGKGKILSRLHLGGGATLDRSLTPHWQPSPVPDPDGQNDSKAASTVNTPKLGPSGTPKVGAKKGGALEKRLLSKDPKKERQIVETKEKKRKEREAAASDREGRPAKKQATKKANAKVKSTELVQSSDDEEEEGEVKVSRATVPSRASPAAGKPVAKAKPKAPSASSPESSAALAKTKATTERPVSKAKTATPAPKGTASPSVKPARPAIGRKSTPQSANGLSAPTSQHKSALSPSKSHHRPNAPSPLGAARPRVASDVSDRSAIGIQRARQGADTPRGLGITNVVRKRHDTVTSTESFASSGSEKQKKDVMDPEKARKPAVNETGTPKVPVANGIARKPDTNVTKRKADDQANQTHEAAPAPKHRKTESSSSQSQQSHSSSTATAHSTARTSPDATFDSSSSDSAASIIDTITYRQGVNVAERFRDHYYPAYAKMYDEMAVKQTKGEAVTQKEKDKLWSMHRHLEQMKREIRAASQRENGRE